ncbi:methylmalonyl-CoA mutase family protein [Neobacillus kokaensis]|uniref:Methylmalonyl-CoA mutase n=1 Tax=Neobacillus kokaensis TaxID=2759023 RepID=A0ABQ3N8C6_9BACI|nr:methylmalonyl-CoA mutase family protein [Neobacillus kokaensis]GHH97496.1 methylmalonyl-CoA mutase [Neobacillus kokaensis]
MMKDVQAAENKEVNEGDLQFSEFPVPSYEEWREQAEKSLKGASFKDKLVTNTYEGIRLKPLYTKKDLEGILHLPSMPGTAPYLRGTRTFCYKEKPWEVSQELHYRTPEEFNEAAKSDLKRGQTMLNITLDRVSAFGMDPDQVSPEDVGKGGVSISSLNDITKALEGIDLEQTPLLVQAGCAGLAVYSMLIANTKQVGQNISKLRGCIGMDPLGALAKEGTLPFSLQTAYDLLAKITLYAKDETPELKTIFIQGDPYHNAGSNAVQELAFTLASAVETIRELQERGVTIQEIASRMLFSFSIGSNVFMEIAKLRAGRILWAKIIEVFGGDEEAQKMLIHARTSSWTKTKYDPYVNMLRGTAEAFAAIVGGADSLHVSPFDEALGQPDEFSRRIARNTQIILEKEAHLAKVADPAGGSWYVESLTDSLAKQAWQLFQQIEGHGGMYKALKNCFIQGQIKEVADQRFENIGRRKDKFVGTNMYPNLSEEKLAKHQEALDPIYQMRCAAVVTCRKSTASKEKEKLLGLLSTKSGQTVDTFVKAFGEGVTIGEWIHAVNQSDLNLPIIKALKSKRGAEPFETLRENSEIFKEKNGSYPKVFLANIGPIPQHKPRADFAAGFFEAGGFEIISNKGFDTAEQAAASALASGASIVVICSNDAAYPEVVPRLASMLKQNNPNITLFVAGQPSSEQAAIFKQSGVDEFIHVRSNCYQVLFDLQQQKGIG